MANSAFGIDLGTNNIKIYSRADDSIMIEKNMIAIENKNTLFAYGDSAFEMYEKAPGNIHISYPLCNGVIADIKNMETLVKFFIGGLTKGNIKGADYYVAVPTDITEVEKRAFYDLIKDANVKAKKIMVVEKAIADGLGMDIDVKNSQGVLLVNVGYDTTEISILSLGGIVLSHLINVGGKKFDEAIRSAIRKEFSLIIGGKTAENVKISLRDLEQEGKGAVVYGRDIVTGLPVEREIPTTLVDEALQEHFSTCLLYTSGGTDGFQSRRCTAMVFHFGNSVSAVRTCKNPVDFVLCTVYYETEGEIEFISHADTDRGIVSAAAVSDLSPA